MNPYIAELKRRLAENPPNFGDGDSILTMLYESYSDANRVDDDRIKADFHELYQAMNGMPLREMDRITDLVCALCRDHERAGFVRTPVRWCRYSAGHGALIPASWCTPSAEDDAPLPPSMVHGGRR